MPRKIRPKRCACGCKAMTRGGEFLPGHATALYSEILDSVGGMTALRAIVEEYIGRKLKVRLGDL